MKVLSHGGNLEGMSTVINGIFQGDIIIRSAVVTALKELRENPSLIDDVLAGLPKDVLTSGRYGDKTIDQCKKWFLNTEIPVRLGLALAQLKSPIITIAMNQNAEEQATIGDVNYEVGEADPTTYTVLSNTASSLTVNEVIDAVVPSTGSFTVGTTVRTYTSVDRATKTFGGMTIVGTITPGTTVTFPWRRALESVQSRESYDITVMVEGEVEYLLFLYSLVLFGILRRKEDLLDARGYTRMTWQVGVAGMLDPSLRENFFTRAIQLTGFVQHGWPKYDPRNTLGLISTVDFGGEMAPAVHNADGDATSTAQTPTEPPPPGHDPFQEADWADRDILSGKLGP
jgi:hypothetical protein